MKSYQKFISFLLLFMFILTALPFGALAEESFVKITSSIVNEDGETVRDIALQIDSRPMIPMLNDVNSFFMEGVSISPHSLSVINAHSKITAITALHLSAGDKTEVTESLPGIIRIHVSKAATELNIIFKMSGDGQLSVARITDDDAASANAPLSEGGTMDVHGILKDASGNPIAGGTVMIATPVISSTTDDKGAFLLSGVDISKKTLFILDSAKKQIGLTDVSLFVAGKTELLNDTAIGHAINVSSLSPAIYMELSINQTGAVDVQNVKDYTPAPIEATPSPEISPSPTPDAQPTPTATPASTPTPSPAVSPTVSPDATEQPNEPRKITVVADLVDREGKAVTYVELVLQTVDGANVAASREGERFTYSDVSFEKYRLNAISGDQVLLHSKDVHFTEWDTTKIIVDSPKSCEIAVNEGVNELYMVIEEDSLTIQSVSETVPDRLPSEQSIDSLTLVFILICVIFIVIIAILLVFHGKNKQRPKRNLK